MNDHRPPSPNMPAPDFSLPWTAHETISLGDLQGHPAVLVFYPGDWEPVSHQQLALYQQHWPLLHRFGAALLMISVDSVWNHTAFGRTLGLTFPLLSDFHPRGAVSQAYGVYLEDEEHSGRAVVVLDADGLVSWHRVYPTNLNSGFNGILTTLEGMSAKETHP